MITAGGTERLARLMQCYEETIWDLTHMLEGAKINGGDEGGSTSTSREEARNVASDPSGPELFRKILTLNLIRKLFKIEA